MMSSLSAESSSTLSFLHNRFCQEFRIHYFSLREAFENGPLFEACTVNPHVLATIELGKRQL